MINATHYVLDLETMGKGPTAAIVAIGCVRIEHAEITGRFYHRVSLASSLQAGLTMDASTVQWWLQQSDAARAEINGNHSTVSLLAALCGLSDFMRHPDGAAPAKNALLWGNGSSFDNVIIGSAYDACMIERPWRFWNDRDLRTLLALYPEAKQLPFEGTKHHAMADAEHEARQLIMAMQLHSNRNPVEQLEARLAAAQQNEMAALDLLSRIRQALGDDGQRMQDELIAYCAELGANTQPAGIGEMVARFLAWPLPASVKPDPCALDTTYPHRYGTNLMTANEAASMFEHALNMAQPSTQEPTTSTGSWT